MLSDKQLAATSALEPETQTQAPHPVADAETLPPLPDASSTDNVPETVGRYRLVRRLGGGGMGAVYEALDTASGRRVALKLMKPESASSQEAIDRFRREGELASKLAHPRCVFVLAADEEQGRPYIVMELMTGSTLADLVKDKGPLPPELAVRKILDVMEGLQEAHALGLIHRDVKPSNCFLEADGRVKVGDFGLAKSLPRQTQLTRTGTFLGTPLFASPEQIRMERVDIQSDVYSVAATLYFLLTGQAPFQTGDSMATMARIVADDPPSLRELRPQLPKALDKVVLRGLERDRKRRWQNLEEFRQALLPFLPAKPSIGGLGLRFVAYCVDLVLLAVGGLVMGALLAAKHPTLDMFLRLSLNLAYFGVLEGIWGRSLGKRLVRLHVGTVSSNQPPGLWRASLRAGIVVLFLNVGGLGQLILIHSLPEDILDQPGTSIGIALGGSMFYLTLGLLVCTMRKRNSYRGLHEFLSGTRTYRLRWTQVRKRCALETPEFHLDVEYTAGLPEQVGPYLIRGALRLTLQDQTLLGYDAQLSRAVWIWMRPASEPALDEARRAVNRMAQIRWLSCGTLANWQWDAFLAPTGCPLPDLVRGRRRLSWSELRPILEDLAEEFRASCAEGPLPPSLATDQVWVASDSRVQLVGAPLVSGSSKSLSGQLLTDQKRVLAFLGEVAVLALEGKARPGGTPPLYIQAPVPLYAASLLSRLLLVASDSPSGAGGTSESVREPQSKTQPPYDNLDQFQADLLATQSEPVEITRGSRARHLAGHALLAYLGLAAIILPPVALVPWLGNDRPVEEIGIAASVTVVLVAAFLFFFPAYLTHGGTSFLWSGIVIVRSDGRRASRFRCVWRALLSWGFIAGLLTLARSAAASEMVWLRLGTWVGATVLFVAYMILIVRNPARAPHDYLAGTYLVPK
jgi:hypothetical protein